MYYIYLLCYYSHVQNLMGSVPSSPNLLTENNRIKQLYPHVIVSVEALFMILL